MSDAAKIAGYLDYIHAYPVYEVGISLSRCMAVGVRVREIREYMDTHGGHRMIFAGEPARKIVD